MLDNPVGRELVKSAGTIGLAVAGPDISLPVAAIVASTLGVGTEALGYLSEKRRRELFDSEDFVYRVIRKIENSEDFAAVTYSVWQKYCFESSIERRKMLKAFLQAEAVNESNNFENFSRIEFIIQNASLQSLRILKAFHSKSLYGREIDPNNARSRLINLKDAAKGVQEFGLEIHILDLEYRINELCNFDLLAASHGRFDGPFYNQTKLGFILLDYINITSNED